MGNDGQPRRSSGAGDRNNVERIYGGHLLKSILSKKIIWSPPGTRLISSDARVLALVLVFSTAVAAMFLVLVIYTFATDAPLIKPHDLIADRSLPREQAAAQIIAARRYDTFWNSGDE